jgi:hypothetical protein
MQLERLFDPIASMNEYNKACTATPTSTIVHYVWQVEDATNIDMHRQEQYIQSSE